VRGKGKEEKRVSFVCDEKEEAEEEEAPRGAKK